MIQSYSTPGVYREDVFPASSVELRTGVPAFLGYANGPSAPNQPVTLTSAENFAASFGAAVGNSYLSYAVSAFFANGGSMCHVVRLDDALDSITALRKGLDVLTPLDTLDLVAAPDIMRLRQPGNLPPDSTEVQAMQMAVLDHCTSMGDRFAILDSLPGGDVRVQRGKLRSPNGALYAPWLRIQGGAGLAPPCGHVAGVYARSDENTGVHKAPANEALAGVTDVEVDLTQADQDSLNPMGVNCIRAFPGRGILVWGARTLSGDPAWTYVNSRRILLTAVRWIARNMADVAFEPHDDKLWARVKRELNAYFMDLFRKGALKGATAADAFYVKCDASTSPPELREQGNVAAEVGLCPGAPSEFIVVRIVQSASGVSVET